MMELWKHSLRDPFLHFNVIWASITLGSMYTDGRPVIH